MIKNGGDVGCNYNYLNNLFVFSHLCAFSALTLLVGQQEGHPACKN